MTIVLIGCFLEQTAGLRLALVAAGTVALLWPSHLVEGAGRWSTDWGLEASQRTGLLCGLALLGLVVTTAGDASWYLGSSKVRVWNVYHYGIGAKYFPEVGYEDLYRASLQADADGPGYWKKVDKVRSLETYEVVSRTESRPYDHRAHFTDDRYEQLTRDLASLSEHRSKSGWKNIFRDRGYNATPFWTVIGRGLSWALPLDRPATLKALTAIDLVLLAGTLWLVYRCFGSERLALFVLLLTVSPVNDDRLLGGLLQYDWLCAGVAALCLFQRRRPGWAGVVFSYAVLTRAFPIAFVGLAALPLMVGILKSRRLPRRAVRFVVALTLACLAGVGVSLLNGRGMTAWTEWADAISLHRDTHLIGDRRIGLEHFFTEDVGQLRNERSDEQRLESLDGQRGSFMTVASLLILATVVVGRRVRTGDAWILGQIPVFALLVLSRYYHSFLATFALMGRGRRAPLETRAIVALQLMVFGGYSMIEMTGGEHHPSYVAINGMLVLFMIGALALTRSLAVRQATPTTRRRRAPSDGPRRETTVPATKSAIAATSSSPS